MVFHTVVYLKKKKERYKVFILLKVTHSLYSAKNRFWVNKLNSLYWFILICFTLFQGLLPVTLVVHCALCSDLLLLWCSPSALGNNRCVHMQWSQAKHCVALSTCLCSCSCASCFIFNAPTLLSCSLLPSLLPWVADATRLASLLGVIQALPARTWVFRQM